MRTPHATPGPTDRTAPLLAPFPNPSPPALHLQISACQATMAHHLDTKACYLEAVRLHEQATQYLQSAGSCGQEAAVVQQRLERRQADLVDAQVRPGLRKLCAKATCPCSSIKTKGSGQGDPTPPGRCYRFFWL